MKVRETEGSLASAPAMQAVWTLGPLTPADPKFLGISVAAQHVVWNL